VRTEGTTTSLELFETSNTHEEKTALPKVETCSTDGETSSRMTSTSRKRLPRRWMPTMTPRTKNGPTMAMTLTWECRNGVAATEMAVELEDLLRAATKSCVNLPGWCVHWQLSFDPKAKYRLGLLLWMEPEPPVPA